MYLTDLDALPTVATLSLFAAATMALFVTPGPATTYLVARAIGQGRSVGLTSAVALATGDVVHVVMATAGISALLMASSMAFTAVKWAGAAYLVWIGIRTWRATDASADAPEVTRAQSTVATFREGFLVEVLNPKTALFFLAFVPQFVDPSRGSAALQFLALGLAFVLMSATFCCSLVVVAAHARGMFSGMGTSRRPARLATGGVYVGLGVAAALAEAPR